jgi:hypothetical protein
MVSLWPSLEGGLGGFVGEIYKLDAWSFDGFLMA